MKIRIKPTLNKDAVDYLRRRSERHKRSQGDELSFILYELLAIDPDEQPKIDFFSQPEPSAESVFRRRSTKPSQKSSETLAAGPSSSTASSGTAPTKSSYKGVYPYRTRWQARVMLDGQMHRIGIYETPREAAVAYDDYIRGQSGGMAPVNFPRSGERQAYADGDAGPGLDPELKAIIYGVPNNPPPFVDPTMFDPPEPGTLPQQPIFETPDPPGIIRMPRDHFKNLLVPANKADKPDDSGEAS